MRAFLSGLVLVLAITGAQAQSTVTPAPAASAVTELPAVSVSGVQPGPGLWKVSRGDHVLWVLGTLPNLPAAVQWRADEVDRVLGEAGALLLPPRLDVKVDSGFFGKLFLLPSALSARKNPDGKTLQEVLPAPLYARWAVLKAKYIGRDEGIERWRPLFAARELYKQALKHSGLRSGGQITATVRSLAERHGVRVVSTDYRLEIREPREVLKIFKAQAPEDVACFARTLDSVEHDLPLIAQRAAAWATGDIATLRALPDSHHRDACIGALSDSGFARELGIDDVPGRLEAVWLAAAEDALARYPVSVAILPMEEVLDTDGYLAKLAARGYRIEPPDADAETPAPAASAGR
ncbi:TraB/GumN family protein [Aerosticca soli]|uniref:TraB/GumN family protein n=1 Tax=Aerosticca soli TaxID=2010829 RepID=A0A2Z6E1G5_9GAMM|nr:TraB/GumN family protein [Aerosticca soli]BBD78800.1 hypothetical protein ALSL_0126 [Aerosticca soli]